MELIASDSMTDSAVTNLVSACQQGNRDAQRRLYEEFGQRVYQLAFRIVGSNDAEDLTQQIFLQVFQKLRQFQGGSQFQTWLFRLATNECLMHLRSRQRKREIEVLRSMAQPGESVSASAQVDAAELLETALARLEPELRSIFVLREMENLNYQELSNVLEISEGTVASRLNRARKQLREHLVDLGWEP
ncbi:MAG: sigma-70 family RNA polymerase sigma factor [Fuerstiella sp.]